MYLHRIENSRQLSREQLFTTIGRIGETYSYLRPTIYFQKTEKAIKYIKPNIVKKQTSSIKKLVSKSKITIATTTLEQSLMSAYYDLFKNSYPILVAPYGATMPGLLEIQSFYLCQPFVNQKVVKTGGYIYMPPKIQKVNYNRIIMFAKKVSTSTKRIINIFNGMFREETVQCSSC